MADALLIVDVQNDFCPGGALAVPNGDRVIPVLNEMIEWFAARGEPVYLSRDWHPTDTRHFKERGGPWPVHCVAGTRGAAFHPDLQIPPGAIVISKGQNRQDDGYSAFEGASGERVRLADDLRRRGVTTLYIGGLATDYCVRATALDARREGFDVVVLTDAVAGIGEAGSHRAIEEMRVAGASLAAGRDVRGR